MRLRRVLLGMGAATVAAVLVRRRSAGTDRVELAYADGSTLLLDRGTPGHARLVAAGRAALAAARG